MLHGAAPAAAHKVSEVDIPRLSKAGCPSDQTLDRSGGAVSNEPRSEPYLLEVMLEIPNRPVCAAKERDHWINGAATPPCKGGDVRLKARTTREVKVLSKQTLSGLKPNATASWRHEVGSSRR